MQSNDAVAAAAAAVTTSNTPNEDNKRPLADGVGAAEDELPQCIPESLLALTSETHSKKVRARQDARAAIEGELRVLCTFRSYLKFGAKGVPPTELLAPPDREKWYKTADGRSFPAPFQINVVLEDILEVPGKCERLPESEGEGWRVRVGVRYEEEASKPKPKQWLADHYKAVYAGTEPEYKSFPVRDFISETGVLGEYFCAREARAKTHRIASL